MRCKMSLHVSIFQGVMLTMVFGLVSCANNEIESRQVDLALNQMQKLIESIEENKGTEQSNTSQYLKQRFTQAIETLNECDVSKFRTPYIVSAVAGTKDAEGNVPQFIYVIYLQSKVGDIKLHLVDSKDRTVSVAEIAWNEDERDYPELTDTLLKYIGIDIVKEGKTSEKQPFVFILPSDFKLRDCKVAYVDESGATKSTCPLFVPDALQ